LKKNREKQSVTGLIDGQVLVKGHKKFIFFFSFSAAESGAENCHNCQNESNLPREIPPAADPPPGRGISLGPNP